VIDGGIPVSVSCQDVINAIEKIAPKFLAMDWDNVGLQVGYPERRINSLLVTLDITAEVVKEAVHAGVDMIIAHHPLIFRPLNGIRLDTPVGALLAEILRKDIQVYVAHTNFDGAKFGTSYYLARALGLVDIDVLELSGQKLYKIVVFVPEGYEDRVREAMGAAGAGWIGKYSHCTFQTPGTGTFKPLPGSSPFIGSTGVLEKVSEYRLETIVSEGLKGKVLKAMFEAHPYEEVAFDVYQLENKDATTGLGKIGSLEADMTLAQFAAKVKEDLGLQYVNVAGSPEAVVRRVAVCGGSGAGLIHRAKEKGADVLLTGDVKYHEALEARELGLNVIDAGHNASEKVLIPALARYLEEELNNGGKKVAVYTSKINTDPWAVI